MENEKNSFLKNVKALRVVIGLVYFIVVFSLYSVTLLVLQPPFWGNEFQYFTKEQMMALGFSYQLLLLLLMLASLLFIILGIRRLWFWILPVVFTISIWLIYEEVGKSFPYPIEQSGYNGEEGYRYERERWDRGPYSMKLWKSKMPATYYQEHNVPIEYVLDSVVTKK